MSIYNFNFKNAVVDWLPPDKRGGKLVRFLQSLAVTVSLLSKKIFTDYKIGSSYPLLEVGDSYGVGELVNYRGAVYESLSEYNITQPPSSSWRLYLPNFLGVDQRLKFTSQKLVLEYALNLRFNTAFRQPPAVSDVYIQLLYPVIGGGIVSQTESAAHIYSGKTVATFVGGNSTTYYPDMIQMIIHCPNTIAVGGSFGTDTEIKTFVNNILPFSIRFSIVYY